MLYSCQRNAQRAMALFKETRDENELLKSNFDALKQAYQGLQSRAEKERTAAQTAREELARVVSDRELQFTQWRAELDVKSKQFEELKDQIIPPHELEEIRFRMAEELELPNREKMRALEAELDRSREDYFQMRREVEKLKISRDQLQAEHEQNMMEAAEKHRAVENELNIRITALQVALEDTTEAEELHSLQRELAGARLREQGLMKEVADVRADLVAARVALDRAGQETRDAVGEVKAELQRRALQVDDLKRKVGHLDRELHQEIESHQRTEGQVLSWERENGALRRKIDDLEEAARLTAKTSARERDEERAAWARDAAKLRADLGSAVAAQEDAAAAATVSKQLAEEEYQRRIATLKAEHARKLVEAEEAASKEEAAHRHALRDAKDAEVDARNQLAEAKRMLDSQALQVESADRARREALETASRASAELSGAQAEADGRIAAVDELEQQLQRARAAGDMAQRNEAAALADKTLLEEAMAQLKVDFAELSTNVEEERAALRGQIVKAQDDAGALVRASEASLKAAKTELAAMKTKAKKFRAVAKKIKEQSKSRISQLAKQLKGQDATIGKLREMLAQADDRNDAAQAEAARNLHAAQRRAEELELLLADHGKMDMGGGESSSGGEGPSSRGSERAAARSPVERGLYVDVSSPKRTGGAGVVGGGGGGEKEKVAAGKAAGTHSSSVGGAAKGGGGGGGVGRRLTALPRAVASKDERET